MAIRVLIVMAAAAFARQKPYPSRCQPVSMTAIASACRAKARQGVTAGRRVISVGVWAPEVDIERIRAELAAERETPEYRRKLEAGRARRAREQDAYVEDFRGAVLAFLGFHARHAAIRR